MTRSLLAISAASLTLIGCASAMSTAAPSTALPPGHAIVDETVIAQIHTGQTLTDVRDLMRREPERRTVDGSNESWGYVTDDRDKVTAMTWIVFTDRKVSAVIHQLRVRV